MKIKKVISLLMTAIMLFSAIGQTVLAVEDSEKISLSDKTLSGGASYQNQNPYGNAFDGDTSTYFDGSQGSYCQVDLEADYELSAIRFYPRNGRSTDKPSEYAKRMNNGVFSASLDGINWDVIYTVPDDFCTTSWDSNAVQWYEITASGTYRYVKYSNDTIEANIAEIEVYGTWVSDSDTDDQEEKEEEEEPSINDNTLSDDFSLLERTDWAASTNSAQSVSGNNSVGMVLDGNTSTIWHSKWSEPIENNKDTNPIYLQIDMGSKQSISGIKYTPRMKDSTGGSRNGVITAYEVYVSTDGESWTKIAEGNLGYTADDETRDPKNIIFAPAEARYVRLVVRDNLTNGNQYVASCAEFDMYTYSGDISEHPITKERENLTEAITTISAINTEHEIKNTLLTKANTLLMQGSVDGIRSFISATGSIIDALGWMDRGIDDVYIGRIMDLLVEQSMSAAAITTANSQLAGFYETGAEVKDNYAAIWQDEFTMPEDEYELPLYERIASAITRAKARIDSDDGNDYIMLKELVSYVSGMYGYTGYENSYGRNSGEAEAVVCNINFALKNLDSNVKTELTSFKSGEIWLDTLGSKISAHGGQIIKQGDTYYWYGEDNKVSYSLTTGVSCYSSTDLKNWKYEGLAFKAFDDGTEAKQFTDEFMTDSLLGQQGRIERPKVIYNENTGKYVMWMHLEKNGNYALSLAGVATADSPTGPFEWQWYGSPVRDSYVMVNNNYSQTFRDMNLFVDDDGTAYVFYSSENNQTMYAVRLNDEYTWIDDDGLTVGTSEDELNPGEILVPDMRQITSAKYTYNKTSFTRYQLASGGAMALNKSTDEDGNTIYVSKRSDGRIYSPEYPETGRWARVGQNLGTERNASTTITSTTVNNNCQNQREAPAPIKIDGKYYLVTSALSGWKANPSLNQVADSILGTWISTGNPMTGTGPNNKGQWSQNAMPDTSFNSQSTCIVQLPNGQYMYMGDRWKNGVYETSNSLGTFADVDVKASTYVWLPITFETDATHGENTLKVHWSSSWSYDDLSETWETEKSTASVSAQVRATNGEWTNMNSNSTKFVEGTSAIEVNGGSYMGAFYSFDHLDLPEGAEIKSVSLTMTRALNYKNIYFTVLRTETPNDLTSAASVFSVISAAVANSDKTKIGTTSDDEAGDGYGAVSIDITDAYDADGVNSYFIYLPGAGSVKRSLQADAKIIVEYKPIQKIAGDINQDGKITSVDALLALKMFVDDDYGTSAQRENADVDCDGMVTVNDVQMILRYASGEIQ